LKFALLVWQKPRGSVKSKFFEQGLNNLSLEGKSDGKEPLLSIRPPPPPAPPSPATSVQISPSNLPPKITLDGNSTEKSPNLAKDEAEQQHFPDNESSQDIQDDDFGDFQAAGWWGLEIDIFIIKFLSVLSCFCGIGVLKGLDRDPTMRFWSPFSVKYSVNSTKSGFTLPTALRCWDWFTFFASTMSNYKRLMCNQTTAPIAMYFIS